MREGEGEGEVAHQAEAVEDFHPILVALAVEVVVRSHQ
jgi:hypothetical protein